MTKVAKKRAFGGTARPYHQVCNFNIGVLSEQSYRIVDSVTINQIGKRGVHIYINRLVDIRTVGIEAIGNIRHFQIVLQKEFLTLYQRNYPLFEAVDSGLLAVGTARRSIGNHKVCCKVCANP